MNHVHLTSDPGNRTTDRAQALAASFLDAFRDGLIPKALAPTFLEPDSTPSTRWSWRNRILIALEGHTDARGFRQWQQVGRSVKKGEKACYILRPKVVTVRKAAAQETGEESEVPTIYGFCLVAVFGFDQTEGEPLAETPTSRYLQELPLRAVADLWDIKVSAMPITGAYGVFRYPRSGNGPQEIRLAVDSHQVWAHELIHAADHRRGNLRPENRNHVPDEIVAELGAATLLQFLGIDNPNGAGAAWSYLLSHNQSPAATLQLASQLLERTAAAVALLLDTAAELAEPVAA